MRDPAENLLDMTGTDVGVAVLDFIEGSAKPSSPPSARRTIEETLKEVQRCTREAITINTFMLERSSWLTLRGGDGPYQPRPRLLHRPRPPRRVRPRRLTQRRARAYPGIRPEGGRRRASRLAARRAFASNFKHLDVARPSHCVRLSSIANRGRVMMPYGAALQLNPPAAVCATCHTVLPPTSNFCGECGAWRGTAHAMKRSRCAARHATVLFCDVVGYTAISERLDPEAVFGLMEQTFGVVLDAVHRHGGTVNQFLGDGAMALFDHPERAINAGQEILKELQTIAAEARRLHGVDFSMRIGIDTGTVSVGAIGVDLRADYTALGATARVAASLLHVAHGGEIVVTEATRRLAGPWLVFERLGTLGGNDDIDPVTFYGVVEDEEVAALGWHYENTDDVEVPDALYA
jgi:class 3 adenylate cyclase